MEVVPATRPLIKNKKQNLSADVHFFIIFKNALPFIEQGIGCVCGFFWKFRKLRVYCHFCCQRRIIPAAVFVQKPNKKSQECWIKNVVLCQYTAESFFLVVQFPLLYATKCKNQTIQRFSKHTYSFFLWYKCSAR